MRSLGVVVQARLGSTRLPGKMLLPFHEGLPLLKTVLRRIGAMGVGRVILATGRGASDDPLARIAADLGMECFRGDENDVRRRFLDCARECDLKKIIRVCADNPFLDTDALRLLRATLADDDSSDYIGFRVGETPAILTHFGFWAEGFTRAALERAAREDAGALYKEHVTNYFYWGNPDGFRLRWLDVDAALVDRDDIRLTIDTSEDFKRAQAIFSAAAGRECEFSIPGIVRWLDENPALLRSMKETIAAHPK
jgi:spore coat polysaccharide biosynthesis protein SpsF